jgi:hypothetical protein
MWLPDSSQNALYSTRVLSGCKTKIKRFRHKIYLEQTKYLRVFMKIQFLGASATCEKRLPASSFLSVCMSVTLKQAASNVRIFFNLIFEYFSKIQVSLKSDQHNGYFIWTPAYAYKHNLAHFFLEWEMFQKNVYRKSEHTFYVQQRFSPKIVPLMAKCGKILYSRTGHRSQYGACALHDGYLRLQTHSE